MRPFGDEIANSIHEMKPGNNPLAARFTIHHSPYALRVVAMRYFEVFPESLKAVSAPYFVLCFGMAKRFEIILKCIFVQDI